MLASLACALRRLACRYWAGRVALRENRAREHHPAGPRGSEGARLNINLLKSNQKTWAGPRSVAACVWCASYPRRVRAVRDSTLVAWYRALTHLAREGRMTVTIGRRELL